MRVSLRTILAWICWPMARLANLARPGIRILMYHRVDSLPEYDQLTVSPAIFRQQMEILAKRYRVIPLSQALTELASGKITRNTVVITFDDGYHDNVVHALPVLKELSLPATVFITTGFAARKMQHPRYANPPKNLHMDWQEIEQWQAHEGNEVGAHSCTHPYLSRLPDEPSFQEISECLNDFARAGMSHNGIFCYPSGDVTDREARYVQKAGYIAAVTVSPGVNHLGANRYWLRRTEITDRDDVSSFRLKLDGAFDFMHVMLHMRRQRQFARAAHKK